jgi:hypothetical protein
MRANDPNLPDLRRVAEALGVWAAPFQGQPEGPRRFAGSLVVAGSLLVPIQRLAGA